MKNSDLKTTHNTYRDCRVPFADNHVFFQCKIFLSESVYLQEFFPSESVSRQPDPFFFSEITQYTPPQKSNGRSLIKDRGEERERRPNFC